MYQDEFERIEAITDPAEIEAWEDLIAQETAIDVMMRNVHKLTSAVMRKGEHIHGAARQHALAKYPERKVKTTQMRREGDNFVIYASFDP